jgi:alpha/beta superfamily hydrolase
MAGRLQERMVTIARGDHPAETLEGVYLAGGPDAQRGAVLAPPHPQYGGSMESPVLTELAWACCNTGITSLRFNWRGVGASTGEPSGSSGDADTDYGAALLHLAESVPGPLVACGYSFGAACAVRIAATAARVDRLVLVAPPPSLVEPDQIADLERPALLLVGAEDTLAPPQALSEALLDAPDVTLEVLPRTDHFFAQGLAALSRLTQEWLAGTMV